MVELDGRTRVVRLIKAEKQRKEIFKQIIQCNIKVNVPKFGEILTGAKQYYFIKSQWGYEEFYGINEKGLLNFIRHTYTNYQDYLDVLKGLDNIPSVYRLVLGYSTETKVYQWLKKRFNRKVEKDCVEIFEEFKKWRENNEKKSQIL